MIMVQTPLGSNVDYTAARLTEVEANRREAPGGLQLLLRRRPRRGRAGERGNVFVRLVDRDKRGLGQPEIMKQLRRDLASIPGVLAFPANISPIGGMRGEPLQFAIVGPELPSSTSWPGRWSAGSARSRASPSSTTSSS